MIEYARAADGTHIAYEAVGEGPTLLVVSDGFVPVDAMREEPNLRSCLDRLARSSRVVTFDRRGVGASDPPDDVGALRLEHWVTDAAAVLDAVGASTAVVMASVENSTIGLLLAALHPHRVDALVLVHASARGLVADDYPIGVDPSIIEAMVEATTDTESAGMGGAVLALNAPSVADDVSFQEWWQSAGRRGASPAMARRMLRLVLTADVRWALPRVAAPVLVLHREHDQVIPISHGRYVAEHVQAGRFELLPGADDLWWVGETDALLNRVEEVLLSRGVRSAPAQRRKRTAPPAPPAPREGATGPDVIAALLRRRQAERALRMLTQREREVLELMAEGCSNTALCERLFLSPKTVEKHISSIFTKLGLDPGDDVHRRVSAVLRLLGAG